MVSFGGSQRSVRPSPATWPLKCSGLPGATLSRWRTRVGDHADVFPAESCERTCQYQSPSPGCVDGDHAVWSPLASSPDVPLRTTPRHIPSEQTRNSSAPVPANDGLLNVAFSSIRDTQPPSAGEASPGTAGAAVSSWKLCVALQADWLPAASVARACQ